MDERKIESVGVLGCGLMGSGIAEVCARKGLKVVVVEVSPEAVEAGQARVQKSLGSALERGRITQDKHDEAFKNLVFTSDWSELSKSDIVIEAIAEDADLKVAAFKRLDETLRPGAILATNTSSIPIMRLATATTRSENVIGIHFFNPVPVLPLVELVPSLMTSEEVYNASYKFASQTLEKHVVRSPDRAGFVVNALLIPYILSAIRMLESGFATAEDIDAGMVKGCAHPMGPLALADLIGLDTTIAVANSLYSEFKEPLFAPPPLLSRMVDAGLVGRKTKRGFYRY